MQWSHPIAEPVDLPTPVAADAVRIFADADDWLKLLLDLVESAVRFTLAVALARHDDAEVLVFASERLGRPTIGTRIEVLRRLDTVAPGSSGWSWKDRVTHGDRLAELCDRKRSKTAPTVDARLGHVAQTRNAYAHGRIPDPGAQRQHAEAISAALIPALRCCDALSATYFVPRRITRGADGSFTAWWLRGPARRALADGRRLPLSADAVLSPDIVYRRADDGSFLPLHPFVIAANEHALVLDQLEGESVTYHIHSGVPTKLVPSIDRSTIRLPRTTAPPDTPAPSSSPSELRSGGRLGGFRVIRELGTGAFSTAYEARSLRDDTGSVTLKVLRAELATDPWHRSVFESAYEIGRFIDHPNVARVHQCTKIAGHHVLIREHVIGSSLAAVLRTIVRSSGRSDPDTMVAVVLRILAALTAIHGASDGDGWPLGAPHGALGPGEVLISKAGEIKLIGFARVPHGTSRLHTSGHVRARQGYVAPEVVHGFDERSDVYAAAVILWEALCLRRAFPDGHRVSSLERPSRIAAVPLALDAVVLRGLSRNPSDRPHSAAAFASLLLGALPSARDVESAAIANLVPGAAE